MSQLLKIDFISDISCPWCAIGLAALQQAIARLPAAVPVSLRLQPFELAPELPVGGESLADMLTRKYGSTPEQQAQVYATLRLRGAEVGFEFAPVSRDRIYQTLKAHRLLHWAGEQGQAPQRALKMALLQAYFTRGENPSDDTVLLRAVEAAGLETERARAILASDEYTPQVRERQRFYTQAGISAVPSVIINDQHLVQGGQPPEVFEQALRQVAAQVA